MKLPISCKKQPQGERFGLSGVCKELCRSSHTQGKGTTDKVSIPSQLELLAKLPQAVGMRLQGCGVGENRG